MMNVNMRRALKQPTLRMTDGGEARADLDGMEAAGLRNGGELCMKTGGPSIPAPKRPASAPITANATIGVRGRSEGELELQNGGMPVPPEPKPTGFLGSFTPKMFQVTRPVAAPPVPVAPTSTVAPTALDAAKGTMAGGQSAERTKLLAMRHGGSAAIDNGQGGHVPGEGEGDKIPAKYEPGEFVVSNAMLDARPSLRGELQALRKDVLADQGMTVAEADAKATGGRTLRAFDGFGAGGKPYSFLDAEEAANQTKNKGTFAPKPQAMPTPTAMATEAAKNPGMKAMPGVVGRAGRALPVIGTALSVAAEGQDVAKVAADPNATKIDVGTQAAEGISKVAGATAGGLAGASVGGPFAPITGAAGAAAGYFAPGLVTKGLRYITGQDTASPIDRAPATAQIARPAGANTMPSPSAAPAAPLASSAPQPAPAAPSLRTQSFAGGTPEAIAAGKQIDSGSKYRPGNGEGMMRNSKGDIVKFDTSGDRYAPVSQEMLNRAYAPTDYSREDAVRKSSGTVALPQPQGRLRERPNNMSLIEEVRYNTSRKQDDRSRSLDIQEDANRAGNSATLRGQDLNYGATKRGQDLSYGATTRGQDVQSRGQDLNFDASMYGANLSAKTARASALRDQDNKNREFSAQRYDKGVEQDGKAMESARKALTIYGRDKEGKPYADEAQTNAAFELAQRQNPKWATLPPDEQAQHLTTARDVTQLIGNLEKNQNNTLWQKYGLGNNNPKMSTLPNLNGATLETLGIVGGLTTPGASAGDYKLTIDGKPLYLTRGDVSEDQLAFLEKQGVKIKKD